MFSWFSKKKNKIEIIISAESETSAHIDCYWPKPNSDKEATNIIQAMAAMLVTSIKPDIMQVVINSIITYGIASNTEKISNGIVTLINKSFSESILHYQSGPVVNPREAFK